MNIILFIKYINHIYFSGGDCIKDSQIQNCITHAKKRAKVIHKLIETAQ